MKFENIIFDWSGTLVDDLALTIDATNAVFAHYGKKLWDEDSFRRNFILPYPDFYAKHLPGVCLDELEGHFRHSFDRSRCEVLELAHARDFLEYCRQNAIGCYVLTSMDPAGFFAQAKNLQLDHYFKHCYAGVRDKRKKIHELLHTHALDAKKTAFIGDMTHDVDTARHAGVCAIAVLTGYQDRHQLQGSLPDYIMPNLQALLHAMQQHASA